MRSLFDALGSGGAGLGPELRSSFGAPDIRPSKHESAENEADEDSVHKRYRTIFISDLHLGTPGCQARALLDFLRAHPSDNLYLVGDIVDGWTPRRARMATVTA